MQAQVARPLRPGTQIEYAGMLATVVADYGSGSLDVLCEGFKQKWLWNFEGESCKVVSVPPGKLAYDSFDEYVKDFPESESSRAWVTNRGKNNAILFRLVDPPHAGSPHGGLAGNFMSATLLELPYGLRIAAHDCDDGLMFRDFEPGQKKLAEQVLDDMKALVPFSMWDAATMFGFKWE